MAREKIWYTLINQNTSLRIITECVTLKSKDIDHAGNNQILINYYYTVCRYSVTRGWMESEHFFCKVRKHSYK